MAWQNLHEDLADLFGEITSRADGLEMALAMAAERKKASDTRYRDTNWRELRAYFRKHYAEKIVTDAARHERVKAKARAYAAQYRAANRERINAKKRTEAEKARQRVYSARYGGYLNSGKRPGGQPRERPAHVLEALRSGRPVPDLARELSMSITTLRRWKKELCTGTES